MSLGRIKESLSVEGAGVKDIDAILLGFFGLVKLHPTTVMGYIEVKCYHSKGSFAGLDFGGCPDD
jgi:hypothetical protein